MAKASGKPAWPKRRQPKSDSPLDQTKGLLRHFKLRARKGLGQHFLVDEEVLGTIVKAAELNASDTVIEVGPGLGILTGELVKRAGKVIAVEVDPNLASILGQTFADFSNLTIINTDILQIDPSKLIMEAQRAIPLPEECTTSYKVVANIPYYIALPILRQFLEASVKPCCLVIMVQKEVAQSIVAEPGGMSLLSLSVQLYGKPVIVDYVPAQSFYPPPKVDSAIVRIDVYDKPALELKDVEGFFEVVRLGFSKPRKQLHNALAQGLWLAGKGAIELLSRAGIEPQRRAQTLSLDDWARVYQAFTEWVKER